MADALLTPVVAGACWTLAAGLVVRCSWEVKRQDSTENAPLMGVLGAFVFAAQMLNFAIPGTGSSGHLGGGLLLAVLLGPHAAFLVMASILTAQALLFADGGLLALGANAINLGFFTAFLAYPCVYRPIAGSGRNPKRVAAAALAASVVGLQLGSLGVVLETTLGGISSLPLVAFLAFMQPIHLAIGIVEGLVTSAVIMTLARARPEVFDPTRRGGLGAGAQGSRRAIRRLGLALTVTTVVVAGGLSALASARPDGLEWALERAGYSQAASLRGTALHRAASELQAKTAILPDYELPNATEVDSASVASADPSHPQPALAGLVGAAAVLCLAGGLGVILRRFRHPKRLTSGVEK